MSDYELITAILENGGATWSHGSTLVTFDSGYMVSDGNSERTFPLTAGWERYQIAHAIQHYTREFLGRYQLANDKLYFGAWIDNNTLYLDLSENVRSLSKARQLAHDRGEKAIFDNAAGNTLPVLDTLWRNNGE